MGTDSHGSMSEAVGEVARLVESPLGRGTLYGCSSPPPHCLGSNLVNGSEVRRVYRRGRRHRARCGARAHLTDCSTARGAPGEAWGSR